MFWSFAPSLSEGPLAFNGVPELVPKGAKHNTYGGRFGDDEADRDAHGWKSMNEVGRAIDGVDNKGWLRGDSLTGGIRFFSDKSKVWILLCEAGTYEQLYSLVDFGHDISGYCRVSFPKRYFRS